MNVGDRIGDYEITAILGAGGMGQVYKVRNILSERTEAMKVLLPNLEGDTELADRFLREIKVQAALDHPNIAKLNTASRISNQLIMIMEFVDGTSIEKLLEKGPMTVSDAASYAGQVLDALAYAHAHGVVHRDIKPANVMITPAGRAKLMDFGIAGVKAEKRLTQTGRTVGSLYYMSPEQIQGLQPDPRSDLYSLGVTLYEMVTGKRPFQGDSDYQIMAAHLQQVPAPPIEMMPGLPDALNEIIVMAIAKDTAERFQSADAFHAALRTVLAAAGPAATTVVRPALQSVPSPSAPTVLAAPRITPQSAPTLITPQPVPPPVNPSTLIAPPPLPAQAFEVGAGAANAHALPPAARPPVAVPPSISLPPGQPGSRRGLYMVVGSIATLLVLAAAVVEGPKFFGAGAQSGAQSAAPSPVVPTQPAPATAQSPAPPLPPQQSAPQSPSESPNSAPRRRAATQTVIQQRAPVQPPPGAVIPRSSLAPSSPPQATATRPVAPQPVVTQTAAPQAPAAQPVPVPTVATQPPPQSPPAQSAAQAAAAAQMNELREKFNLLSVRAGTAKAGLRSLEQQMARQGLGLRADIREAEGRMDYLMTEASSSIRRGDSEAADRNLQMAERALGTIEKFQGR